jgi:hypothetical protein
VTILALDGYRGVTGAGSVTIFLVVRMVIYIFFMNINTFLEYIDTFWEDINIFLEFIDTNSPDINNIKKTAPEKGRLQTLYLNFFFQKLRHRP